ncbi:MAG: DUF4405 domain-containing protein [Anaerolineae bacterium]|nr:DUF4405 domain-containing protein [Anaerolineae bacterium]
MTVKPRTNYILDMIILALFVAVLVSGLLLWQVYPGGGTRAGVEGQGRRQGNHQDDYTETTTTSSQTSQAETVLGITKPDMRTLHDWAGILMGVLVLIHVVFHWKWIVCQTRRLLGLPTHPPRIAPKQVR